MTIVVTVKVNDGIVLAADSATTLIENGTVRKVYERADKVFNLVKGLPIGAMTYGAGQIGSAAIATISKDLRAELSAGGQFAIDPKNYTIKQVAETAKAYFETLYKAAYPAGNPKYGMGYLVCGCSRPGDRAEAWQFLLGDQSEGPDEIYAPDSFGPRWFGQGEALDRLVLGMSSDGITALVDAGRNEADALAEYVLITDRTYRLLFQPPMPIQDAIDLAKFLAGTSARFMHFSMDAATIGGPIEVAAITKHEGFKWVSRKHYYTADLNP